MNIAQYTKEYTDGRSVIFKDILSEVNEFFVEVIKLNKDGVKEEFEDVLHFVQLWLYSRFGINGEIWGITKHSVKKFIDRKLVWNKIYAYIGLPLNISGYVGNYNKIHKVINHLQKFGISKEKAEEVYAKIVLDK